MHPDQEKQIPSMTIGESAAQTSSNPESVRDQDLWLIAEDAAQSKNSVRQEEAQPLLLQTFEGEILDVNDQVVIVEFTMGERRELRKFSRAQFLVPEVRIQDVVQLRCKLVLAPPTAPLSDAEVEQWARDHVDLEAVQVKTKRPKSLLEDEE